MKQNINNYNLIIRNFYNRKLKNHKQYLEKQLKR